MVQNCRWEDNFQRLLIMSGPGLVRGCTFTRMGSNISLNAGMGLVGGIPSDITITDNTFTRSGGPAMNLIGIQDSRIENNVIDSPVRASVVAKPQDETDRQAIMLKHSRSVTVKANTLHDPENHTQPDTVSGSRVLGLEATKEITLDGEKVPDAPALTKARSKE